MDDQHGRHARLRYTATGALAALTLAGAIAGTAALAAKPGARSHSHAAVAKSQATNGRTSPVKERTGAPEPRADPQAFLSAIQRLVADGTITAAEARVVDREILAGRIDTDSLVASGFTPSQLQAVQQALGEVKRGRAAAAHQTQK